MAAALVVATSKGSTNGGVSVTTDAIDTTGANLLYIPVAWFNGGTLSGISDSGDNTWLPLTGQSNTVGGAALSHWYCLNPTVGSGHTFTAMSPAPSPGYPAIGVLAFSGANGGLLAENGVDSNSAEAINTGSVVPGADGAVIIAPIGFGNAVTGVGVSGGSLAIEELIAYSSGQNMPLAVAYEIQALSASRAAAWAWTNAVGVAAPIVAFAAGALPAPADPRIDWMPGTRVAGLVQRYQAIPSGFTPPGHAE